MSPKHKTQRSGIWAWLSGSSDNGDQPARRGTRSQRRSTSASGGRSAHGTRRFLQLEPLEGRALLATDLASISGRVFKDATGDGFTPGEQVVGATVQLFVDDGDGVFEPGAGDAAFSTPSATTNANGIYRFNRLSAGSYWVRQQAQTVGSITLSETRNLVTISAADADGVLSTSTIDNFDTAAPDVVATLGTPGSSVQTGLPQAEVIGGERDFEVEVTGEPGTTESVRMFVDGGRLRIDGQVTSIGTYRVTWDGVDGNASTVNPTGLGGVDVTQGNTNEGVLVSYRVDQPDATLNLRAFSGAGNSSTATITGIEPGTEFEQFVPFSATEPDANRFQTTTGTGANFSSLGAIQLEVVAGSASMDAFVELVGLIGPTIRTQDFANYTPADLGLTKIVSNATPVVGSQIQYNITLVNNGPNPATGVVVTDQLPAGVTFVSANAPAGTTYNNATGLWTVGNLAVGQNLALVITANVTAPGVALNEARITSVDQNDEVPGNNSSTATTTTPQVDIAVTKTVDDDTPDRNQNVTFTVTAANVSTTNATGVVIRDILPAGLTFVSATPSVGAFSNATGLWTVGNLAASGSANLQIVATVSAPTLPANGTITNTAELNAVDQTDSNANNNTGTRVLTLNQLDIAVDKRITAGSATPNRDETVTFRVTATNSGPSAATGLQITDVLPAGLTFVSASPSGTTTYTAGTGIWNIGNLSNTAGANTATLDITVRVTSAGPTIRNEARVTALNQYDTNPANDVEGENVAPNNLDLVVTKIVDDTTPNQNQNVTFTVTVTNLGLAAATGVRVADTLPAGLTFVSSTPSTGTYNNATGIWNVGALSNVAGSNSATLAIVATVTGQTAIINTAALDNVDQFESPTVNNQQSVSVTPNVLDLALTKTVDDATPDRNQNVTFTVTVTNASQIGATNVQVTDVLPAGLTFVSATPSTGTYNSGTGLWTLGALSNTAGQNSATLQIVATMTGSATLTNTATITGVAELDTNANNNTASVQVTPNVADLVVTKTAAPTTAGVNNETVFTITVRNDGPANATGVQVTDQLPAGLTFVGVESSTAGTTYDSTTGIWNVGALSATTGQNTASLAIRARVSSPTAVSITNDANVTQSNQFDPNTNNNRGSATVTTRQLSKRLLLADTAIVPNQQSGG
jgi:uncharacterized repeat protein (TIGR01451 family)